jgi:hypothetical protein
MAGAFCSGVRGRRFRTLEIRAEKRMQARFCQAKVANPGEAATDGAPLCAHTAARTEDRWNFAAICRSSAIDPASPGV